MEWWAVWLMVLVGSAGVLLAGDRLLAWLEARGWIAARRTRRGTGGMASGVAGELMNLFQPTRQVTIAEQEWQKARVDASDAAGSAPHLRPEVDLDAGRATLRPTQSEH